MTIYLLSKECAFPDPQTTSKPGILAIGGDLEPKRLMLAYQLGIFPWFNKDDPGILWWCPEPRFVLFPDRLKMSRSLKKTLKKGLFEIRFDTAFSDVIRACSQKPRPNQDGTWITDAMIHAYCKLHELKMAHSVEAYCEGRLVGGLYGVAMGPFFFGESMFHTMSDASKAALVALVNRYKNAPFIDCQVHNHFFESMGATNIPRTDFLKTLKKHIHEPNHWYSGTPPG